MPSISLGESIPPDTAHAVSVSLPTWASNVGYEEGQQWVMSRMTTGYPRFFIHNSIKAFAADVADRYGQAGQVAMLFPGRRAVGRCLDFVQQYATPKSLLDGISVVHLALDPSRADAAPFRPLAPTISAILLHPDAFPFAKQYWQHSGDGISSRRAEYCHRLFSDSLLVRQSDAAAAGSAQTATHGPAATSGIVPAASVTLAPPGSAPAPARPACMKTSRGPKRYQRPMSPNGNGGGGQLPSERPLTPQSPNSQAVHGGTKTEEVEDDETSRYLEERFGRNLDLSFVQRAKSAIRRRITGAMTADNDVDLETTPATTPATASGGSTAHHNIRGHAPIHEEDVYLMPCGMNAIFNAHRFLLAARPEQAGLKSVCFGFPYVDTLKILQKFGGGCEFYGHASEAELDELERRLKEGERFLGLFCEFPGNPLLTCPNLRRIHKLSDLYGFAVVVDETIGTFANINVLPYADMVASSLTKIFSGDCNVMGGSVVLNNNGKYYAQLKRAALGPEGSAPGTGEYNPDGYWPEDVIFMERNSRDFAARIERINANAEAICDILDKSPLVKALYYPKYVTSGFDDQREHYEDVRLQGTEHHAAGGYGGLLSFVLQNKSQAVAFYDAIETAKGPSLGTNFTLTSPYVVLAHYQELEWCQSLGIDPSLLRVSVGLEDTATLVGVFETALAAAAEAKPEDKTTL